MQVDDTVVRASLAHIRHLPADRICKRMERSQRLSDEVLLQLLECQPRDLCMHAQSSEIHAEDASQESCGCDREHLTSGCEEALPSERRIA